MLRLVTDDDARAEMRWALEAEVDAYVAVLADERGRRFVVRDGHARRTITTAAGRIEVTAPRINDKRLDATGERCRFRSAILSPWARKSPKDAEVLPLM